MFISAEQSRYCVQQLSKTFMVVQNSVTFSVTRIGSQVDRSKALNYIRTGQHLLLPSIKMARHMSSVHHNWSLLKSDRFSLQNTLPASIMVDPLTLEVDRIGFATPDVVRQDAYTS